ncbi:unnamed protein product [Trichogramma brassicae]|uniref:Uncharacterized protein n=1 Tax=Trichogramma brassicae TaxID=86971 RepID=A0A6H5I955_9HYME|nr:unnamed protein product [Trichogramma brassicae]
MEISKAFQTLKQQNIDLQNNQICLRECRSDLCISERPSLHQLNSRYQQSDSRHHQPGVAVTDGQAPAAQQQHDSSLAAPTCTSIDISSADVASRCDHVTRTSVRRVHCERECKRPMIEYYMGAVRFTVKVIHQTEWTVYFQYRLRRGNDDNFGIFHPDEFDLPKMVFTLGRRDYVQIYSK